MCNLHLAYKKRCKHKCTVNSNHDCGPKQQEVHIFSYEHGGKGFKQINSITVSNFQCYIIINTSLFKYCTSSSVLSIVRCNLTQGHICNIHLWMKQDRTTQQPSVFFCVYVCRVVHVNEINKIIHIFIMNFKVEDRDTSKSSSLSISSISDLSKKQHVGFQ